MQFPNELSRSSTLRIESRQTRSASTEFRHCSRASTMSAPPDDSSPICSDTARSTSQPGRMQRVTRRQLTADAESSSRATPTSAELPPRSALLSHSRPGENRQPVAPQTRFVSSEKSRVPSSPSSLCCRVMHNHVMDADSAVDLFEVGETYPSDALDGRGAINGTDVRCEAAAGRFCGTPAIRRGRSTFTTYADCARDSISKSPRCSGRITLVGRWHHPRCHQTRRRDRARPGGFCEG